MRSETKLQLVKIVHTLIWAVFAGCILAIPLFTAQGRLEVSFWLIGFVLVEVTVLAINHMSCPLTGIAGRYTPDRRENFDIYLPRWLARHNKSIFGSLFAAGVAYTLLAWVSAWAAA